jgi:hypothetical protein
MQSKYNALCFDGATGFWTIAKQTKNAAKLILIRHMVAVMRSGTTEGVDGVQEGRRVRQRMERRQPLHLSGVWMLSETISPRWMVLSETIRGPSGGDIPWDVLPWVGQLSWEGQ